MKAFTEMRQLNGFRYSVHYTPDNRVYIYKRTPKAWGKTGGKLIKYLASCDAVYAIEDTARRVQETYESLRPPFAESKEREEIEKVIKKLKKICDNSSYGKEALDYATMRLQNGDTAEGRFLAQVAEWMQDVTFVEAVHRTRQRYDRAKEVYQPLHPERMETK